MGDFDHLWTIVYHIKLEVQYLLDSLALDHLLFSKIPSTPYFDPNSRGKSDTRLFISVIDEVSVGSPD